MSFWAFQWIIKKHIQVFFFTRELFNDLDHSTPKDKEQKEEEQPTDDIDIEEEDNNFGNNRHFLENNYKIDVNEVISILNNNTDLEKLLESV